MLGFVAAILAFIAAILVIAQVHAGSVLCWQTFACLALGCLALHVAGVGAGWGPAWRRTPPA